MSESILSHSNLSDIIPRQLQRNDILFVMIPTGEKGLQVKGWNLVSNGRRWDNPILSAHIANGGNYGMYPAPGSSLLFLDIDNADAFHQAGGETLVSDTYRYSAWSDRQKYRAIVECSDIPDHFRGHKISIRDGEQKAILELFFPANKEKTGGQCVAPGSIHPNGNRYESFDHDAPILPVCWDDIQKIATAINPDAIKETIPDIKQQPRAPGSGKTLSERYGLSVMDHLPNDAHMAGPEIRGAHPIHGSTSKGGNVAINPAKGTFYCFRCGRGGDAAIWDAINRGIIQCDEPYDDEAFKKHAEALHFERPEIRVIERIAWKKLQQARGRR